MSYATPTNFTVYGLPAEALVGFTGTVQDYLDAAFGRINTHLRGRYKLPMINVPIELVEAECVIAGYILLSVRGFDPEDGIDRNILIRYREAMKWLMSLSDGMTNLDIDADTTPGVNDGAPIVSSKVRDSSERFV